MPETAVKLLGVLGGLGPISTFCFCELLTAHTKATRDADHIDMLISSHASTPDRTAFILGKSEQNPLPAMIGQASLLERNGADLIVLPCNTAHYFYDGLQKACRVPILNIIRETVDFLHRRGVRRFGLLATEGTVRSDSYAREATPRGMVCLTPCEADQAIVSEIIYGQIKQNRPIDEDAFRSVVERMRTAGCERIVLGCTELSLLRRTALCPDPLFVDSLGVLAYRTILACGKEPQGFPVDFAAGGWDGAR